MFERHRGVSCLIAVSVFTFGCGRSQPDGAPASGRIEQPEQSAHEGLAQTSAPDPADSINQLIADLAAGRGDAVFAAFPPRYREDLDRFLATRVRPADADVRQVAEAVARFAETLADKERFALASERFEITGPAAEVIRTHFGAINRLIAAVARWPGWSEPAGIDAKALTSAIASAVSEIPELSTELENIRFETASRSKDRAGLRIVGDGRDRELTVVRVGDTWMPATIVDRWNTLFGNDESAPQEGIDSSDLASLVGRLEDVTGDLARISTQADFDALTDRAATLLLATAAQADREPRAVRRDEFVTVEILGEMTESQKDQVVWRLVTLTDAPRSGLADAADLADEDGVLVTVGPVADIVAFSKRLNGFKVDDVDAEKRSVTGRFIGP